jgi:hypothetical protein
MTSLQTPRHHCCHLEHERQGSPPALRFDYETVMDGRSFKRPVNYDEVRVSCRWD